MNQRRSTRTRRIAAILVVVGAAGAVSAIRPWEQGSSPEPETDGGATSISTAVVTVGDLVTTVTLDGSLTSSSTTVVVHRIEGETVSATPADPSSPSSPSSVTDPAAVGIVSAECVVPPSTETPTTTLAAPADTTSPSVTESSTMPGPTSGSVPETTTTTITSPSPTAEPSTTIPSSSSTTEACDESTTTVDPTAGSVPSGSAPTGGLPSAGASTGAATGAGAGATTGATGATGSSASAPATQVVTSVRPAGSDVGLGDVLYTVDGAPVVVLRGLVPAWRTLSTASDDGFDVAQLEDSLVTLGYDPDGDVTVDGDFDTDTEAAVERWQEGLGIEATGEVALGSVLFIASDQRIASVAVVVGEEIGDGDVVVELAAASHEVVVEVPTEDQQFVAVGTSVELGDVTGTVTRLRSVEADSGVGVQAVITPTESIEGAVNGAVVEVGIRSVAAASVTLVPVDAVASRLDGTYAVQVVDGGDTRWVTVEIVGRAGRNVGVSAASIVAGSEVVVPD